MRRALTIYLVAVLFLAGGALLQGCAKKVSKVEGDKITAEAAKKEAEARAERERMAARLEEEKLAVPSETIRESILKSEEEVPPQGSARGKEFAPADTVLKTVYFDFDQASLTEEAKLILRDNAEWMRANPTAEVLIEGHCDERGTDEYNLALGERRAMSVRKYLISLGVDPARLYTISYGEEKPVDLGHNEEAWAKNRRAQFQVTSF
jgi:peptidoglycan-associated lipoprotein